MAKRGKGEGIKQVTDGLMWGLIIGAVGSAVIGYFGGQGLRKLAQQYGLT